MQDNEIFYSDLQLAARYNVSRCTIWRWTKQGVIPKPVKIGPATRWRFSEILKAEPQQNAGS